MKKTLSIFLALLICGIALAAFSLIDFRSGIAQEEMEKFNGSPTPTFMHTPEPTPIAATEVVQADTTLEGDVITVNGPEQKQTVSCTKYDRVMLNGDGNIITVQGTCRQIMINGDRDEITVDAASEFVLNGTGNTVRYSRYVNGRQPAIVENQSGNTIEKTPFVPDSVSSTGSPAKK